MKIMPIISWKSAWRRSVENARSFLDRIYEVAYPKAVEEREAVAKYALELDGIEEHGLGLGLL